MCRGRQQGGGRDGPQRCCDAGLQVHAGVVPNRPLPRLRLLEGGLTVPHLTHTGSPLEGRFPPKIRSARPAESNLAPLAHLAESLLRLHCGNVM